MTFFDIPVGLASVFAMILFGYFFMTVWYGKAVQPVKIPVSKPVKDEPRSELAG